MSKQRPEPPQPAAGGEKKPAPAAAPEAKQKPSKPVKPKVPSPWPWGPFARVLVSLLVAFHLVAVFAAPWYIQLESSVIPMVEPGGVARPSANGTMALQLPVLPAVLAESLRYYLNLLYINNGYDFFSPNPVGSHLIRYEIFNEAGEKITDGQLPDRREQWPRLFYHRHMMLVEQSRDVHLPPGAPFKIADYLLEKHGGETIRLSLVRHHLITPAEVLEGTKINAPSTYEQIDSMDHRRIRRPADDAAPAGGTP